MNKLICLGSLSLAILAGCVGGSSTANLTNFQLPESVAVTFSALVPDGTPAGSVQLVILDEVTGFAFNSQYLRMDRSGENSYSVELSVPIGAVIKYRYARADSTGSVDEIGALGQPLPFRAYLVDGPGHLVHDLIAAWADTPVTQDTGRIGGTLTAAANDAPLSDMVVTAAGVQTRSDAEGHFVLEGLPQGLHNLLIYSRDGAYLPFQQGALVAAQNETPANITITSNLMANVIFLLTLPEVHVAGVPVYVRGNISQLNGQALFSLDTPGQIAVEVAVPTGVDVRYKYTLGDSFWNAEHLANGSFSLRQIIVPSGTTSLIVEDRIETWSSGDASPIWFDLMAPETETVHIQFKLGDWGQALPMWKLDTGHWAYKLFGPTNFSASLEYRYCQDAGCTQLEAQFQPRSITGGQGGELLIEDRVDAWQE